MNTRRLATPVVIVLLLGAVVLAARAIPQGVTYTAELHHAAGLSTGDPVRVAGLDIGRVKDVSARRDTVYVEFTADRDVTLTTDSRSQVKLASLLGQRYLELDLGDGPPLDAGASLPREQSVATYTIDRFWLDSTYEARALDLDVLDRAIDVLGTDLAGAPEEIRAALDGMTAVAGIVTERDAQLSRLLGATRNVTDLLLDQQDELDGLMENADLVAQMIVERREAIRLLLRDTRALAVDLARLARANREPMAAGLRDLRTVLRTLERHRDDLDVALERLGPTIRHFASAAGDGPWLGVNSPYAIFPDDLICPLELRRCE